MTSIKTTIINGRIEFAAPTGLPDGTEVLIQVSPSTATVSEANDSSWNNSPAGIDAWLNWYEGIEPFEMTAAELAEIESSRQARKRWELSQFEAQAEKLAKQWQ